MNENTGEDNQLYKKIQNILLKYVNRALNTSFANFYALSFKFCMILPFHNSCLFSLLFPST